MSITTTQQTTTQATVSLFSTFSKVCQEQLVKVTQTVQEVLSKPQVCEGLARLYNAYSIVCSYPKQPLYVLCTPAMTAANLVCPKLIQRLDKKLPKKLQGLITFKATTEQFLKEAVVAGVFLYTVANTEMDRLGASLCIMGGGAYVLDLP